MKPAKKSLWIVILSFVSILANAEVKQFVVTTTADAVPAPNGSLREAIELAQDNDTATITFQLKESGTITLTADIETASNLSISAPSGEDSVVISNYGLIVRDHNLSLNNIHFKGQSAAVQLRGDCYGEITNSTFSNCELASIYCCGSQCLVDNCKFTGGLGIRLNSCGNTGITVSNCLFDKTEKGIYNGEKEPTKYLYTKNLFANVTYGVENYTQVYNEVTPPVIDASSVKGSDLYVYGHTEEPDATIELFFGEYLGPYNAQESTEYLTSVETDQDGNFKAVVPLNDTQQKESIFTLSATATYKGKYTSNFSYYKVKRNKLVVTNTEDSENGFEIKGSLRWTIKNAEEGDTIAFQFPTPGKKVINIVGTYGFDLEKNIVIDGNSWNDTIIIDGGNKTQSGFISQKGEPVISNITIKHFDYGISSSNNNLRIVKCKLEGNKYGLWGSAKILENCEVVKNGIGIYTGFGEGVDSISSCVISGNDSIGIDFGKTSIYNITNNIIGLTKDESKSFPNGIGIHITGKGYNESITKNVIAGNTKDGCFTGDLTTIKNLSNNYIGCNSKGEPFPNGGNGISIDIECSIHNLHNNIISNNGGYGIYALSALMEFTGNTISSNGNDGIYLGRLDGTEYSHLINCQITNNNGNGITIKSLEVCNIENSTIAQNKGFGISHDVDTYRKGIFSNNTFDGNILGGINTSSALSSGLMSQNLFTNTSGRAITNAYQLTEPTITEIRLEKGNIFVVGIAGPNAKIELFLSYGESQTANEFIDSVFADGNGGFIYKVAKKYNDHLKFCISATATFNGNTSELSDGFCWFNPNKITTVTLSDTVCGDSTYTGHGFNIDLGGLAVGDYEFSRSDTTENAITNHLLKLKVNPQPALFNVSTRKALCLENGGTATAVVTKGNGPFTFAWRLGGKVVAEDSVLLHMLTDTAYTLTVTDANGCASTQSDIRTTLEELPLLNNLKLTTNVQGQQCYGIDNGRITVAFKGNSNKSALKLTAAGKKGVTKSAASSAASGKFVIDSLAPGSYQLFLDYDAEGCASTPTQLQLDDAKVSEVKTQLKIDDTFTDTKNATCVSEPDGHVTVRMANWTDGYQANLYLDGELLATKDKADSTDKKYAYFTADGLNGGTVSFVVTDVCGYSDSAAIGLVRLEAPAIGIVDTVCQVPCSYSECGYAKLELSGGHAASCKFYLEGQPAISFSKDTVVVFDHLPVGHNLFHFKHTDKNCSDYQRLDLYVSAPDTLKTVVKVDGAACADLGGTAKVTSVKGGAGSYSYSWTDFNGKVVGNKKQLTKMVPDSTYLLTVTDKNGCSDTTRVKADFLPFDYDFGQVTVKASAKGQRCFGLNTGSIYARYSGYNGELPIRLLAKDAEGQLFASTADADSASAIDMLAPGRYALFLDYRIEGCGATNTPFALNDTVEVPAMEQRASIDSVTQWKDPTCLQFKVNDSTYRPNGYVEMAISNWDSSLYKLSIFHDDNLIFTTNNVPYDSASGSYRAFAGHLKGGELRMVATDACGQEVSLAHKLKDLEAPSVKLLAGKQKLLCGNSDDGFLEYSISGGDPGSYSLAFLTETPPTAVELDPNEHQHRFDNLGANGYNLWYRSNIEGCKDQAQNYQTISAPPVVKSLIATSPISCLGTSTAQLGVVPNGAMTGVEYVQLKQSENLAKELVNEQLAEGTFPGIKKVWLCSHKLDENVYASADSILKSSFEVNGKDTIAAQFPPLALAKSPGSDYVPKKWIGFINLPADTFYLVTEDNYGCVYSERIDLSKKPDNLLKIDSLTYLGEGNCDAKNRRIEMKVSGGWERYLFSIADVDKTDNGSSETVDDKKNYGGLAFSQNYKAGDTTTYIVSAKKDTLGARYKSAILMPGRYLVSVMDAKGCIQTSPNIIEVTTKVDMGGRVKASLCNADKDNEIRLKATAKNSKISGYAIRYEDTSVGEVIKAGSLAKLPNDSVRLTGIPPGIIGVFAYAENGCSGYDTFYVPKKKNFLLHFLVLDSVPANCYGDADGRVTFNMSGGYWPYRQLDIRRGNAAAVKIFTESDKQNKEVEWQRLVKKDSVTTGANGVKDTLSIYTYQPHGTLSVAEEDTFLTTDHFTYGGLKAGLYTLEVTDAKGCKATGQFTIGQPDSITFALTTSPVCPEDRKCRLYPKGAVRGGVPPYTYAVYEAGKDLDEQAAVFTDEDHAVVNKDLAYHYMVRDAHHCLVTSQPYQPGDTLLDTVMPDYLVAKYHDLDDVLVITDVTKYGEVSNCEYDSFRVSVSGLPYGVEAEFLPRELFTYGVPADTFVVTWYGDTIQGPQFGLPANYVGGFKNDSLFLVEAARIIIETQKFDTLQKAASKKMEELEKKAGGNTSGLSDKDQKAYNTWEALAKAYSDSIAYINQASRYNCNAGYVRAYFLPVVDHESAKRLQYVRLVHSKPLKQSDINFDIEVTTYITGCSFKTTLSNFDMLPKGGSDSIYGVVHDQEIIATEVTPNPVPVHGSYELTITLGMSSEEAGLHIARYDLLGNEKKEALTLTGGQKGNLYVYTCTVDNVDQFELVTVSTNHERVSQKVLVNGDEQ